MLFVEEEKGRFSSTLPDSQLRLPVTKDRLTREWHTNVFNINFVWHSSRHKEIKTPKEIIKPECFFTLGLKKSYKSWKGMTGPRVWAKYSKLGET